MPIIAQQLKQRVSGALKENLDQKPRVQPPKRMQLMGDGEDHMKVISGKEPRFLPLQPALFWQMRTLRTRSMAAGVVPDFFDVASRTSLNMTSQSRGATLHDGL